MFQFTFISIIILRVILCPLFCIGCDDVAQEFHSVETHACTCSDADRGPCRSEEVPTPTECPCPCDAGCVCQVTPELNSRSVASDVTVTVDFLPAGFDSADFSQAFASRAEVPLHRFGLESGRDVRISYVSFLL